MRMSASTKLGALSLVRTASQVSALMHKGVETIVIRGRTADPIANSATRLLKRVRSPCAVLRATSGKVMHAQKPRKAAPLVGTMRCAIQQTTHAMHPVATTNTALRNTITIQQATNVRSVWTGHVEQASNVERHVSRTMSATL